MAPDQSRRIVNVVKTAVHRRPASLPVPVPSLGVGFLVPSGSILQETRNPPEKSFVSIVGRTGVWI
jgi:hypothetical protein